MTIRKPTENPQTAGFVLKHRIVGAAFLLLFGAWFVPWLLGSSASTSADVATISAQAEEKKSDTELNYVEIEKELIKDTKQNKAVQEQVYISKITPLDKPKAVTQKTGQSKPAPAAPVDKKITETAKTAPKTSTKTVAKEESKTPVVVKPKPKPQPKPVEVGWIVSVGVFLEPKNVTSVVKDLKSKSFKPSTSAIMTSKGKATRVWLGPFSQRVEAAKVKARLKATTGEPGLIKAYP